MIREWISGAEKIWKCHLGSVFYLILFICQNSTENVKRKQLVNNCYVVIQNNYTMKMSFYYSRFKITKGPQRQMIYSVPKVSESFRKLAILTNVVILFQSSI